MNARIEPTLTLEEVAKHLEQWRSHKKKGERILQSYGTKRSACWALTLIGIDPPLPRKTDPLTSVGQLSR
jgi:hypothetical protein